MGTPERIYEEASIVLVGSFNPAIFHPEWLCRHSIISEDDAKGANIEIIHNELTKFALSWLNMQVTHEKFIALTNDASRFAPLRDLVMSAFKILEHTPTAKLGMNRNVVFSFSDEAVWHRLGDTLAPKTVWEKTLPKRVGPKRVGLKTLVVQSPRTDELPGHIEVTIRPDRQKQYDVGINVNSHVELEGHDQGPVQVLSEYWTKIMEQGNDIAETLLKEALAQ